MQLFCGCREIENIQPTREALLHHVKRSAYFGGYVWGCSLTTKINLPPFYLHDWNPDVTPQGSNLEETSRGFRELI